MNDDDTSKMSDIKFTTAGEYMSSLETNDDDSQNEEE